MPMPLTIPICNGCYVFGIAEWNEILSLQHGPVGGWETNFDWFITAGWFPPLAVYFVKDLFRDDNDNEACTTIQLPLFVLSCSLRFRSVPVWPMAMVHGNTVDSPLWLDQTRPFPLHVSSGPFTLPSPRSIMDWPNSQTKYYGACLHIIKSNMIFVPI